MDRYPPALSRVGRGRGHVSECGSFYNDGDFRICRAVLSEDLPKRIIMSTSFDPATWNCVSCEEGHSILPRERNVRQWGAGRKVIILADQGFPAVLPASGTDCMAIIRVEGGSLSELTNALCSLLNGFSLPNGSLIILGMND